MKKVLKTIDNIKTELESIKGKEIKIEVNKGRKKISKFNGELLDIYPSVFKVRVDSISEPERTYSYTEVLCGNVKIFPKAL